MLAEAVQDFIEGRALLPQGARVVVGLSGGIDSVALLHVLRQLGYQGAVAAHVNYGLREGAAGDEAFARRLCASFSPPVPFRHARLDAEARADERGESLQEAARRQRYRFFEKVAAEEGARHVAVGHHRDDQAETLLLNLLRGSGPEGLAGMRAKRRLDARASGGAAGEEPERWLVRPLLGVGRVQVEAYAEAQGLSWRRDPSNRDRHHKRAALRHDVLPALQAHFPGAASRLARTAALMGRYVDEALRPELRRRFEAARAPGEAATGGALRLSALREAPPVWRGRLLLEGLRQWCPAAPRTQAIARELERLLEAQPGRRVAFGEGDGVWRERRALRFVPGGAGPASAGEAPGAAGSATRSLAPGRPARVPGGALRVERLGARPEEPLDAGGPRVALLDAGRLQFPLEARPWQAGDRLQPLGMDGTKLVSDLLTDAKVPPSERRGVHVVCSGGAVVWVVGYRIAEPAKVRPATRCTARLTFEPAP